jgi:hypothetical protein
MLSLIGIHKKTALYKYSAVNKKQRIKGLVDALMVNSMQY